ncbi:MAG: ankyrin repeat domain-containing protein [Phycisphaerales bacterium]
MSDPISGKPIASLPEVPPIFRAALLGDHDAIHRLVAAGGRLDVIADVSEVPESRQRPATPLMVAAGSAKGATSETVELLLDLGADPRQTTPAGSPASFAALGIDWELPPGGGAERLRLLLDAGSPLTLEGAAGARLVCRVAERGDHDRLAVLLERRAPANAVFDAGQARRDTRARLDGFEPNQDSGALHGAPPEVSEAIRGIGRGMMRDLTERIASRPSFYHIPLFVAAQSGSERCVQMLIDAGADVACLDGMGQTALFWAATPGVVRALARAGVDLCHVHDYGLDALRHRLECFGVEGTSGEQVAAVCRALLESGVSLNQRPGADTDRLFDAAFAENLGAVQFLLEAGVDVRRAGRTALHAICWHWDYSDERDQITRGITRAMLTAGIDPNARDDDGNTPLHEAVSGDGVNLVAAEELVAAGADVNARNNDGQTALGHHYETLFEYDRVVPFLLRHGADPRIANNRGKNAIDIARQMIAGENPDWRADLLQGRAEPRCGWKAPAEPGDMEHQMLEMLIEAANRLDER